MNKLEAIVGGVMFLAIVAGDAKASGLSEQGLDDPTVIAPAKHSTFFESCYTLRLHGHKFEYFRKCDNNYSPPESTKEDVCDRKPYLHGCHTDEEHDNHPEWPWDAHLGDRK